MIEDKNKSDTVIIEPEILEPGDYIDNSHKKKNQNIKEATLINNKKNIWVILISIFLFIIFLPLTILILIIFGVLKLINMIFKK
ncbi:hypothetical protein [Spiroplasma endosymbiont of Amphibalanus improvisus]|uniref:hypothetical protein n=1 Tax=Spiroplasma endosymbiont of Amphibalanus improvisus TaxID=3066327 RepID=UPI00313F3CC6